MHASWVRTWQQLTAIAHAGAACWSARRAAWLQSDQASSAARTPHFVLRSNSRLVEYLTTWKLVGSSRAARSQRNSSCSRVKSRPSRLHLVLHATRPRDCPAARSQGKSSWSRVSTIPRLHLDIHARASVLRLRSVFATSSTFYCTTDARSTPVLQHCTTTSHKWSTADGPCLLNRKSVAATPQPWVMQAKRCEESVRKLREYKTMTIECWQDQLATKSGRSNFGCSGVIKVLNILWMKLALSSRAALTTRDPENWNSTNCAHIKHLIETCNGL
jgi:hypothetical protein